MHNLNIPGLVTLDDLRVLEYFAREVPKNGLIVEIGSFCGKTSYTLAKSCDPSVRVVCIDMWPPGKFTFGTEETYNAIEPKIDMKWEDLNGDVSKQVVKTVWGADIGIGHFNPEEEHKKWTKDCYNIERVRGKSPRSKDYPVDSNISTIDSELVMKGQQVDLLFIDDSHCYDITSQIEYWLPFMSKGGKMSGHDLFFEEIEPKGTEHGKVNINPEYFWGIRQTSKITKKPIKFEDLSSIWWVDLGEEYNY